ncbi:MAG: hypothetical protein FH751_02830 [Firmicutes bacterium]|nr:hypothetical protein [Bacillota bacterium]
MQYINKKFKDHNLHTTIEKILKITEQIKPLDITDIKLQEDIQRFQRITKILKNILNSVDPELISYEKMNEINGQLSQCLSSLDKFINNRNSNDSINNFRVNLEHSIDNINTINNISTNTDSVSEESKKYKEFRNEFNKLKTDIEKEQKKLEELSNYIQNDTINLNEKFIKEQNNRNEDFENFKKKTSKEIQSIQNNFEKKINEIEKLFRNKQSEYEQEIEKEKKLFMSKIEREKKTIMEELKNYKDKATKIVGVIGSTGTAGVYKKASNRQKKESYIWHAVSLLSFIGLLFYATKYFGVLVTEDFTWSILIWRVFVSTIFASFFAYASKQANKYTQLSQQNKKMELELASIDTFISDLDNEIKQEIKQEVAEKIFANKEEYKILEDNTDNDNVKIPNNIAEILISTINNYLNK